MNLLDVIRDSRVVVDDLTAQGTFLHFTHKLEGLYLNIASKWKIYQNLKKSRIFSFIIIAVGVSIVVGFFASLDGQSENRVERVFHITLADPELYENEVYSETFEIDEGIYEFRFVPNGDSPQTLSITLNGKSVSFDEDFMLEGTPHESGISSYFTWKYLGKKMIEIPVSQKVEIVIDPNGNLLGPVSVDILR